MNVFNVDLDNTIIYSYKHDIGNDKVNVEIYQGREISYATAKTLSLLRDIRQKVLIVPTTTRTQEQYERIDLQTGDIPYALICNGGILLKNGERVKEWYDESLEMIKDCQSEMMRAQTLLEKNRKRTFEVRYIEKLFIFTKCDEPESVVTELKAELNTRIVDVFNNGIKVYVVPKELNKGNALRRFKNLMKAESVLAAGDSEFDVSMVEAADLGIVPKGFIEKYNASSNLIEVDGNKVFSDEMLMCIHNYIEGEITNE